MSKTFTWDNHGTIFYAFQMSEGSIDRLQLTTYVHNEVLQVTFDLNMLQNLDLDESTCMLLLGITLLTPDREGLAEKSKISGIHD
jgi:hypothetical protein